MTDWNEVSFQIDKDFRTVSIPNRGRIAGVRKDREVNKVIFSVPRVYKGTDLSDFNIRVNYKNANNVVNYSTITEKQVSNDEILFAWLLTYDVTQYKGNVEFSVDMFTTEHGGTILQDFHSTIAIMKVLDGMDANEHIDPEETTDILTHLEDELTDHAEALKTDLEGYVETVEGEMTDLKDAAAASAAAAEGSKNAAAVSASSADYYQRLARTYAVEAGSEKYGAQQAANAAAASAEQAQQSIDNAKFFDLYVDEDGHLIYAYTTNLSGLDFNIIDHKNLEVSIDG